MTCHHTRNLATAMIADFDIYKEEDQALLHEAVALEPARMLRIYTILQFFPLTDGRRELLDTPIGAYGTVRELLARSAVRLVFLESFLVSRFLDHAPRAVFDQPGDAGRFVGEILRRILAARRADPNFVLYNPLFPECLAVDELEKRLVQDILSSSAHPSGEAYCELVLDGLADPAEAIRYAAVRAAASLVSMPAIRDAMAECRYDYDVAVRQLALENLAPFADQAEVAECIGAFRFDAESEIRRRVLALLQGKDDEIYDHERLGHLAFDPDPRIAAHVRAWFGMQGIETYLNKLAERAREGAWLHPRELWILTRAAFVPRAKCLMKLTRRLRVLGDRADAAEQLICTLAALEALASDLSEAFWVEAAAIVWRQDDPIVTLAWQTLQEKAGRRCDVKCDAPQRTEPSPAPV